MAVAQTIGIEMPSDFPTAAYNAVSERLGPYQPRNPAVWAEYAGGWNAVASRFKTAAQGDGDYTASISQSSTHPPAAERQVQETALFSFFVTGYAAIESFSYALFALASILKGADFPMSTEEELKRIGPDLTQRKFAAHFTGEPVEARFSALVTDPAYWEWSRVRNILAHRQAPPRQHGWPPREPAVWRLIGGLVLDDRTTAARRTWLAGALTGCVEATEGFVNKHFP